MLSIVALACLFIGFIWLVVAAFSENVLWGLAALFIPFVALIYGILHFAELKTPTIIYIIGLLFYGAVSVI